MINHQDNIDKVMREIQDKGFIPIQDHYNKAPSKMMTRFGIVDLTRGIEKELEVTEEKPPSFVIGDSWMTKKKGSEVLNRLVCYLYSRPGIMCDYLMNRYGWNIRKEDFIIGHHLKSYKVNIGKPKKTRLRNTKRNYFIENDRMYIGWKKQIIECRKSGDYWRIVGADKMEERLNVKNYKLVRAI